MLSSGVRSFMLMASSAVFSAVFGVKSRLVQRLAQPAQSGEGTALDGAGRDADDGCRLGNAQFLAETQAEHLTLLEGQEGQRRAHVVAALQAFKPFGRVGIAGRAIRRDGGRGQLHMAMIGALPVVARQMTGDGKE